MTIQLLRILDLPDTHHSLEGKALAEDTSLAFTIMKTSMKVRPLETIGEVCQRIPAHGPYGIRKGSKMGETLGMSSRRLESNP